MNKKTKIARIYCRVSTKEQNLDRQLNLKHWAEQRGFYVAHIYAEKKSGRNANRIQLKDLKLEAEAKNARRGLWADPNPIYPSQFRRKQ